MTTPSQRSGIHLRLTALPIYEWHSLYIPPRTCACTSADRLGYRSMTSVQIHLSTDSLSRLLHITFPQHCGEEKRPIADPSYCTLHRNALSPVWGLVSVGSAVWCTLVPAGCETSRHASPTPQCKFVVQQLLKVDTKKQRLEKECYVGRKSQHTKWVLPSKATLCLSDNTRDVCGKLGSVGKLCDLVCGLGAWLDDATVVS